MKNVDRGPTAFWGLVTVLITASLAFGIGTETRRRQMQPSAVSLVSGDLVRLNQVVDGDTLLVKNSNNDTVTIRILGIKAFATKAEKDPASIFGKSAMLELERQLRDRPIRVLLDAKSKDKHGRYLAELFADDHDIGLALLRQGLVLAYSPYPFASLSLYLHEQELARSERRGLWAVPEVAKRADLLMSEWSRETP